VGFSLYLQALQGNLQLPFKGIKETISGKPGQRFPILFARFLPAVTGAIMVCNAGKIKTGDRLPGLVLF